MIASPSARPDLIGYAGCALAGFYGGTLAFEGWGMDVGATALFALTMVVWGFGLDADRIDAAGDRVEQAIRGVVT